MKPAILLDRDGTLNPDPGYINDPETFALFPGVPEALGRLKQAGFLLVLVTNQSGLARGLVQPENLEKIHGKLQDLLKPHHAAFDRIYFCPHHPDDRCSCRKPQPGMALQAFADLAIDPLGSYLIGDKESDVAMALAAGIQPVFISTSPCSRAGTPTFPTLGEAVTWILAGGPGSTR